MPKAARKTKGAVENWKINKPEVTNGRIVFGFVHKPWWPGVVVTQKVADVKTVKPNYEWVFWYGDNRISEVSHDCLCNFKQHYAILVTKGSKKYREGLLRAIGHCAIQDGITKYMTPDEKFEWAENKFALPSNVAASSNTQGLLNPQNYALTEEVVSAIEKIKILIKSEKERFRVPTTRWDLPSTSRGVNYVQADIGAIRNGIKDRETALEILEGAIDYVSSAGVPLLVRENISVWDICIACRNKDKQVSTIHPYFDGGICLECRENVKQYLYDIDVDGHKMTCLICANGGELLLCGKKGCGTSYCMQCISELCKPGAYDCFKSAERWYCMLCREYVVADGALVVRKEWPVNVSKLFRSAGRKEKMNKVKKKLEVTVLSVYDGISTACHALSRLGIKIKMYYSFETNRDAVSVSKSKFFGKIVYLEDLEKLTYDVIKAMGQVDLIVGASTYRDPRFGHNTPKDAAEHLKHFYEFFRVWATLRSLNNEQEYWIYICVATVPYDFVRLVNRYFACEPYLLNVEPSSLVGQPYFCWGNIPNMPSIDLSTPKVKVTTTPHLMQITKKEKELRSLMESSSKALNPKPEKVNPGTSGENATVLEKEEFLGLPPHITDIGNLTPKQRLNLLGNVINLQAVESVLRPLTELYETEESS